MTQRRSIGKALRMACWSAGALIASSVASLAAPAVNLSTYQSNATNPIGVTYYPFYNQLLLSYNWPNLSANHQVIALAPGGSTLTPFGNETSWKDEVKLTTITQTSGAFTAGDIYVGAGTSGQLWKYSASGNPVPTYFATLPGEATRLVKAMWQDTTGIWGGDLIAVTSGLNDGALTQGGNVWAINSSGVPTLLASYADPLEGVTVVPNNPATYGPLAGAILAGVEHQGKMWVLTGGLGSVVSTPVDLKTLSGGGLGDVEDIQVIPARQNFYGVDFPNNRILTASYSDFLNSGIVGDILIVNEGLAPGSNPNFPLGFPATMWDLKVVNGNLSVTQIAQQGTQPTQWEQITFAPIGVPSGACPLTQGYWKNHPSAWPVSSLTIGGVTLTEAQLITNLKTAPTGGNATLILEHQLISAKLNILNGAASTPQVDAAIVDADNLLAINGINAFVSSSSTLGQQMVNDANLLDQYNNGLLTGCGPD